jgi:uncharacterized protein HemX
MSPLGKLAVLVAAIALAAVLFTGGGVIGDRIQAAKYNRREAARMKQVQASLAAAEAAEKRAEAKEAQAELLRQQNEAKASKTTAADASLQQETANREKQISETYESDLRRINSDLSVCERCRDVCSKLDAAARANPAFGQYRCDADACSEDCPAGDTH